MPATYIMSNEQGLLFDRNPRGGRPMIPGGIVIKQEGVNTIKKFEPVAAIRYHAGYCECGRQAALTPEAAEQLVTFLAKKGFTSAPKLSLKKRIGKWLLGEK